MAMTEAFASTAAVVVPVVAFATIVPFGTIAREGRQWRPREVPFPEFAALWALIIISAVTLFLQVRAEYMCLNALREIPDASRDGDGFVVGVIMWSLVLLLLLPVVGMAAARALETGGSSRPSGEVDEPGASSSTSDAPTAFT